MEAAQLSQVLKPLILGHFTPGTLSCLCKTCQVSCGPVRVCSMCGRLVHDISVSCSERSSWDRWLWTGAAAEVGVVCVFHCPSLYVCLCAWLLCATPVCACGPQVEACVHISGSEQQCSVVQPLLVRNLIAKDTEAQRQLSQLCTSSDTRQCWHTAWPCPSLYMHILLIEILNT